MLLYKDYKPCLLLQDHIKYFYFLECDKYSDAFFQRITSDGSIDLKFNLGAPIIRKNANGEQITQQNDMVTSRMIDYHYIKINKPMRLFGVVFYPWGLRKFTGIPASAIADKMVPAEYLFGKKINNLKEQLHHKTDTQEIIKLMERFFMTQYRNEQERNDSLVQQVSKGIMKSKGEIDIAKLSAVHNISNRSLQQKFKEALGISPKTYAEMTMFHYALNSLTFPVKDKLVSVAYDCGYYDQAHFIRSFKYFTGVPPKKYRDEYHPFNDGNICLLGNKFRA